MKVKGVVEGAVLEAGENIIIARGVNGMGKGSLKAGGNIISKFLQSVTAQADGYIASESVLHSRLMSKTEILIDGKKGFISGGSASAVKSVNVKTLGSPMGGDTIVEVGVDPSLTIRIQELQEQIEKEHNEIQSIQQILISTKKKIAQGVKMSPEQLKYVQTLVEANQEKTKIVTENVEELERIQSQLKGNAGANVTVRDAVHPGTRICIGDVSMTVRKEMKFCKFVKVGGEVKMTGL